MFTPKTDYFNFFDINNSQNYVEYYDCIIYYMSSIAWLTNVFVEIMENSSRSKTGSKYDTRTILCRVFTVFAYIAFGSCIFHLLERDAASRRVTQFEEYYNKTMAAILSRCTSNQTEINITMTRIRQTFMQDVFPKEWDGWGGVNITIQAMTTIGRYGFQAHEDNGSFTKQNSTFWTIYYMPTSRRLALSFH